MPKNASVSGFLSDTTESSIHGSILNCNNSLSPNLCIESETVLHDTSSISLQHLDNLSFYERVRTSANESDLSSIFSRGSLNVRKLKKIKRKPSDLSNRSDLKKKHDDSYKTSDDSSSSINVSNIDDSFFKKPKDPGPKSPFSKSQRKSLHSKVSLDSSNETLDTKKNVRKKSPRKTKNQGNISNNISVNLHSDSSSGSLDLSIIEMAMSKIISSPTKDISPKRYGKTSPRKNSNRKRKLTELLDIEDVLNDQSLDKSKMDSLLQSPNLDETTMSEKSQGNKIIDKKSFASRRVSVKFSESFFDSENENQDSVISPVKTLHMTRNCTLADFTFSESESIKSFEGSISESVDKKPKDDSITNKRKKNFTTDLQMNEDIVPEALECNESSTNHLTKELCPKKGLASHKVSMKRSEVLDDSEINDGTSVSLTRRTRKSFVNCTVPDNDSSCSNKNSISDRGKSQKLSVQLSFDDPVTEKTKKYLPSENFKSNEIQDNLDKPDQSNQPQLEYESIQRKPRKSILRKSTRNSTAGNGVSQPSEDYGGNSEEYDLTNDKKKNSSKSSVQFKLDSSQTEDTNKNQTRKPILRRSTRKSVTFSTEFSNLNKVHDESSDKDQINIENKTTSIVGNISEKEGNEVQKNKNTGKKINRTNARQSCVSEIDMELTNQDMSALSDFMDLTLKKSFTSQKVLVIEAENKSSKINSNSSSLKNVSSKCGINLGNDLEIDTILTNQNRADKDDSSNQFIQKTKDIVPLVKRKSSVRFALDETENNIINYTNVDELNNTDHMNTMEEYAALGLTLSGKSYTTSIGNETKEVTKSELTTNSRDDNHHVEPGECNNLSVNDSLLDAMDVYMKKIKQKNVRSSNVALDAQRKSIQKINVISEKNIKTTSELCEIQKSKNCTLDETQLSTTNSSITKSILNGSSFDEDLPSSTLIDNSRSALIGYKTDLLTDERKNITNEIVEKHDDHYALVQEDKSLNYTISNESCSTGVSVHKNTRVTASKKVSKHFKLDDTEVSKENNDMRKSMETNNKENNTICELKSTDIDVINQTQGQENLSILDDVSLTVDESVRSLTRNAIKKRASVHFNFDNTGSDDEKENKQSSQTSHEQINTNNSVKSKGSMGPTMNSTEIKDILIDSGMEITKKMSVQENLSVLDDVSLSVDESVRSLTKNADKKRASVHFNFDTTGADDDDIENNQSLRSSHEQSNAHRTVKTKGSMGPSMNITELRDVKNDSDMEITNKMSVQENQSILDDVSLSVDESVRSLTKNADKKRASVHFDFDTTGADDDGIVNNQSLRSSHEQSNAHRTVKTKGSMGPSMNITELRDVKNDSDMEITNKMSVQENQSILDDVSLSVDESVTSLTKNADKKRASVHFNFDTTGADDDGIVNNQILRSSHEQSNAHQTVKTKGSIGPSMNISEIRDVKNDSDMEITNKMSVQENQSILDDVALSVDESVRSLKKNGTLKRASVHFNFDTPEAVIGNHRSLRRSYEQNNTQQSMKSRESMRPNINLTEMKDISIDSDMDNTKKMSEQESLPELDDVSHSVDESVISLTKNAAKKRSSVHFNFDTTEADDDDIENNQSLRSSHGPNNIQQTIKTMGPSMNLTEISDAENDSVMEITNKMPGQENLSVLDDVSLSVDESVRSLTKNADKKRSSVHFNFDTTGADVDGIVNNQSLRSSHGPNNIQQTVKSNGSMGTSMNLTEIKDAKNDSDMEITNKMPVQENLSVLDDVSLSVDESVRSLTKNADKKRSSVHFNFDTTGADDDGIVNNQSLRSSHGPNNIQQTVKSNGSMGTSMNLTEIKDAKNDSDMEITNKMPVQENLSVLDDVSLSVDESVRSLTKNADKKRASVHFNFDTTEADDDDIENNQSLRSSHGPNNIQQTIKTMGPSMNLTEIRDAENDSVMEITNKMPVQENLSVLDDVSLSVDESVRSLTRNASKKRASVHFNFDTIGADDDDIENNQSLRSSHEQSNAHQTVKTKGSMRPSMNLTEIRDAKNDSDMEITNKMSVQENQSVLDDVSLSVDELVRSLTKNADKKRASVHFNFDTTGADDDDIVNNQSLRSSHEQSNAHQTVKTKGSIGPTMNISEIRDVKNDSDMEITNKMSVQENQSILDDVSLSVDESVRSLTKNADKKRASVHFNFDTTGADDDDIVNNQSLRSSHEQSNAHQTVKTKGSMRPSMNITELRDVKNDSDMEITNKMSVQENLSVLDDVSLSVDESVRSLTRNAFKKRASVHFNFDTTGADDDGIVNNQSLRSSHEQSNAHQTVKTKGSIGPSMNISEIRDVKNDSDMEITNKMSVQENLSVLDDVSLSVDESVRSLTRNASKKRASVHFNFDTTGADDDDIVNNQSLRNSHEQNNTQQTNKTLRRDVKNDSDMKITNNMSLQGNQSILDRVSPSVGDSVISLTNNASKKRASVHFNSDTIGADDDDIENIQSLRSSHEQSKTVKTRGSIVPSMNLTEIRDFKNDSDMEITNKMSVQENLSILDDVSLSVDESVRSKRNGTKKRASVHFNFDTTGADDDDIENIRSSQSGNEEDNHTQVSIKPKGSMGTSMNLTEIKDISNYSDPEVTNKMSVQENLSILDDVSLSVDESVRSKRNGTKKRASVHFNFDTTGADDDDIENIRSSQSGNEEDNHTQVSIKPKGSMGTSMNLTEIKDISNYSDPEVTNKMSVQENLSILDDVSLSVDESVRSKRNGTKKRASVHFNFDTTGADDDDIENIRSSQSGNEEDNHTQVSIKPKGSMGTSMNLTEIKDISNYSDPEVTNKMSVQENLSILDDVSLSVDESVRSKRNGTKKRASVHFNFDTTGADDDDIENIRSSQSGNEEDNHTQVSIKPKGSMGTSMNLTEIKDISNYSDPEVTNKMSVQENLSILDDVSLSVDESVRSKRNGTKKRASVHFNFDTTGADDDDIENIRSSQSGNEEDNHTQVSIKPKGSMGTSMNLTEIKDISNYSDPEVTNKMSVQENLSILDDVSLSVDESVRSKRNGTKKRASVHFNFDTTGADDDDIENIRSSQSGNEEDNHTQVSIKPKGSMGTSMNLTEIKDISNYSDPEVTNKMSVQENLSILDDVSLSVDESVRSKRNGTKKRASVHFNFDTTGADDDDIENIRSSQSGNEEDNHTQVSIKPKGSMGTSMNLTEIKDISNYSDPEVTNKMSVQENLSILDDVSLSVDESVRSKRNGTKKRASVHFNFDTTGADDDDIENIRSSQSGNEEDNHTQVSIKPKGSMGTSMNLTEIKDISNYSDPEVTNKMSVQENLSILDDVSLSVDESVRSKRNGTKKRASVHFNFDTTGADDDDIENIRSSQSGNEEDNHTQVSIKPKGSMGTSMNLTEIKDISNYSDPEVTNKMSVQENLSILDDVSLSVDESVRSKRNGTKKRASVHFNFDTTGADDDDIENIRSSQSGNEEDNHTQVSIKPKGSMGTSMNLTEIKDISNYSDPEVTNKMSVQENLSILDDVSLSVDESVRSKRNGTKKRASVHFNFDTTGADDDDIENIRSSQSGNEEDNHTQVSIKPKGSMGTSMNLTEIKDISNYSDPEVTNKMSVQENLSILDDVSLSVDESVRSKRNGTKKRASVHFNFDTTGADDDDIENIRSSQSGNEEDNHTQVSIKPKGSMGTSMNLTEIKDISNYSDPEVTNKMSVQVNQSILDDELSVSVDESVISLTRNAAKKRASIHFNFDTTEADDKNKIPESSHEEGNINKSNELMRSSMKLVEIKEISNVASCEETLPGYDHGITDMDFTNKLSGRKSLESTFKNDILSEPNKILNELNIHNHSLSRGESVGENNISMKAFQKSNLIIAEGNKLFTSDSPNSRTNISYTLDNSIAEDVQKSVKSKKSKGLFVMGGNSIGDKIRGHEDGSVEDNVREIIEDENLFLESSDSISLDYNGLTNDVSVNKSMKIPASNRVSVHFALESSETDDDFSKSENSIYYRESLSTACVNNVNESAFSKIDKNLSLYGNKSIDNTTNDISMNSVNSVCAALKRVSVHFALDNSKDCDDFNTTQKSDSSRESSVNDTLSNNTNGNLSLEGVSYKSFDTKFTDDIRLNKIRPKRRVSINFSLDNSEADNDLCITEKLNTSIELSQRNTVNDSLLGIIDANVALEGDKNKAFDTMFTKHSHSADAIYHELGMEHGKETISESMNDPLKENVEGSISFKTTIIDEVSENNKDKINRHVSIGNVFDDISVQPALTEQEINSSDVLGIRPGKEIISERMNDPLKENVEGSISFKTTIIDEVSEISKDKINRHVSIGNVFDDTSVQPALTDQEINSSDVLEIRPGKETISGSMNDPLKENVEGSLSFKTTIIDEVSEISKDKINRHVSIGNVFDDISVQPALTDQEINSSDVLEIRPGKETISGSINDPLKENVEGSLSFKTTIIDEVSEISKDKINRHVSIGNVFDDISVQPALTDQKINSSDVLEIRPGKETISGSMNDPLKENVEGSISFKTTIIDEVSEISKDKINRHVSIGNVFDDISVQPALTDQEINSSDVLEIRPGKDTISGSMNDPLKENVEGSISFKTTITDLVSEINKDKINRHVSIGNVFDDISVQPALTDQEINSSDVLEIRPGKETISGSMNDPLKENVEGSISFKTTIIDEVSEISKDKINRHVSIGNVFDDISVQPALTDQEINSSDVLRMEPGKETISETIQLTKVSGDKETSMSNIDLSILQSDKSKIKSAMENITNRSDSMKSECEDTEYNYKKKNGHVSVGIKFDATSVQCTTTDFTTLSKNTSDFQQNDFYCQALEEMKSKTINIETKNIPNEIHVGSSVDKMIDQNTDGEKNHHVSVNIISNETSIQPAIYTDTITSWENDNSNLKLKSIQPNGDLPTETEYSVNENVGSTTLQIANELYHNNQGHKNCHVSVGVLFNETSCQPDSTTSDPESSLLHEQHLINITKSSSIVSKSLVNNASNQSKFVDKLSVLNMPNSRDSSESNFTLFLEKDDSPADSNLEVNETPTGNVTCDNLRCPNSKINLNSGEAFIETEIPSCSSKLRRNLDDETQTAIPEMYQGPCLDKDLTEPMTLGKPPFISDVLHSPHLIESIGLSDSPNLNSLICNKSLDNPANEILNNDFNKTEGKPVIVSDKSLVRITRSSLKKSNISGTSVLTNNPTVLEESEASCSGTNSSSNKIKRKRSGLDLEHSFSSKKVILDISDHLQPPGLSDFDKITDPDIMPLKSNSFENLSHNVGRMSLSNLLSTSITSNFERNEKSISEALKDSQISSYTLSEKEVRNDLQKKRRRLSRKSSNSPIDEETKDKCYNLRKSSPNVSTNIPMKRKSVTFGQNIYLSPSEESSSNIPQDQTITSEAKNKVTNSKINLNSGKVDHVFIRPEIPSQKSKEASGSMSKTNRSNLDDDSQTKSYDTSLDLSEIPKDRTIFNRKVIFHSTPIRPLSEIKKSKDKSFKTTSDQKGTYSDKLIKISNEVSGTSSGGTSLDSPKHKTSEISTSYNKKNVKSKTDYPDKNSSKRKKVSTNKHKNSSLFSSTAVGDSLYSSSQSDSYKTVRFKQNVQFKDVRGSSPSTENYSYRNQSAPSETSGRSYHSGSMMSTLTSKNSNVSLTWEDGSSKHVRFRNRLSVIDASNSLHDFPTSPSTIGNDTQTSISIHQPERQETTLTINRTYDSETSRRLSPAKIKDELSRKSIKSISNGNISVSSCGSETDFSVVSDCSAVREGMKYLIPFHIDPVRKGKKGLQLRNNDIFEEPIFKKQKLQKYNFKNDPRFMINKQPYVEPKLKFPDKWVSKGLYKFLIDKLKDSLDVNAPCMAERIIQYLCASVSAVEALNTPDDILLGTLLLRKLLVKHAICSNQLEYLTFIMRFTPLNFQKKILPLGKHLKVSDPIVPEAETIDINL